MPEYRVRSEAWWQPPRPGPLQRSRSIFVTHEAMQRDGHSKPTMSKVWRVESHERKEELPQAILFLLRLILNPCSGPAGTSGPLAPLTAPGSQAFLVKNLDSAVVLRHVLALQADDLMSKTMAGVAA